LTPDEYRQALKALTPQQFRTFRERWGGAKDTVDACVSEFAYASSAVRPQWEETIILHLNALGVAGLMTEQQKALDYARQSANATSIAAEAAKRAADAAERSAEAASRSAASSAAAVRATWYYVAVTTLAVIVTLVIAKGC
jgi:hypothetical protein